MLRTAFSAVALCLGFLVGFVFSAPEGFAAGKYGNACGKASWYAMTSLTASGERASPNTMTAAHRTLPFGTQVRVTNLRNGRSAVVRINDRGPFIRGRVIDVTRRVADQLGFRRRGWAHVRMTPLTPGLKSALQSGC